MSEERPFTVSSFYKFVSENRLMAAKCNDCGALFLPPKPMCTRCLSLNLKWTEVEGVGKLLSYTIIHVAPEQFQAMAPYSVGIVEFKNGLRLPGMIRDISPEELNVGIDMKINFEPSTSSQWHEWSRYFFTPI
jgi:uncharacterized protein